MNCSSTGMLPFESHGLWPCTLWIQGAYGMTSLYGVIPPIMALSLQNSNLSNPEAKTTSGMQKTFQSMSLLGDRVTLATVGACAMAVIVGQMMLDLPQFSSSPPVVVANIDKENLTPTNSIISQPFTTLAAPWIPLLFKQANSCICTVRSTYCTDFCVRSTFTTATL